MTHQALWQTIKLVAFEHNLTCSGLAKKCGLDPTTFNNSKLISKSGTPRWPSCYTIAKMLNTLNMTLADFADTYSHAQHILDKKAEKHKNTDSF